MLHVMLTPWHLLAKWRPEKHELFHFIARAVARPIIGGGGIGSDSVLRYVNMNIWIYTHQLSRLATALFIAVFLERNFWNKQLILNV
jgi:hypothetical protein